MIQKLTPEIIQQASADSDPKFKAAFTFLSYYEKCYKQKYGRKITLNKYKEKWMALSVVEDYGIEKSKKVIEYYFRLAKEGHPLQWLVLNFDTIIKGYESSLEDERIRAERRAETARIKKEFLNGNA